MRKVDGQHFALPIIFAPRRYAPPVISPMPLHMFTSRSVRSSLDLLQSATVF